MTDLPSDSGKSSNENGACGGDQQPVVLVTGGAGYIGSHACKALSRAGFTPVVYDNLISGHREDVRWGPLIIGDLEDRYALEQTVREYRPVAVLHFAGHAYVGESVTDPGKYYRNNVAGSLTLLEVMRDFQVSKLVFSSSCATYGIPQQVPIPEDHPQNPINPYGFSKLVMERMMADFAVAHGLSWLALRYFNAAGADPEGELGERHDPETHLIPLLLDAALGRRPHLTVFGTDYETPDGTCIRDYIHVTDLVEAHVLALRYLQNGGGSGHLNLGNGNGFSVKEVITAAERVIGRSIPVVFGDRRLGDPAHLVGDARKAQNLLGWQARFADLETILAHAWAHRRKL